MGHHRNHGRKITHRKGKTKMKRAKMPMSVLALKLRPKKASAVKPIVTQLCRTW